jgi:DNA-binding transcriptional ArsR family regulator
MSPTERPAGESLSPRQIEEVADVMFALSTVSRVTILDRLRLGPHTVSELVEAVGMEQSAVSHQLRVLREHRLVRASRDGRRRVYELYDDHVALLFDEAIRHVTDTAGAAGARRGAARLRRGAR